MSRVLWALVFSACCGVVLSGCHTTKDDPGIERVDYEGREDFAPVPNFRVRVAIEGKPTRGGALKEVLDDGLPAAYARLFSLEVEEEEAFVGLEAEYWTTRGQFTQDLAANQRLDPHGDRNLDGPGRWESEIELHLFSVGAHGGFSWRDLLVLNGTLGLHIQGALVDTDEVGGAPGGRDASEELWRLGLTFGGLVGFTPIVEWFMVYTRFMGHWGWNEHATFLSTFEFGGELTLFPGVAVFVAYRWTNYLADRDESQDHRDSDYDVRLEGPTFGLQLTF